MIRNTLIIFVGALVGVRFKTLSYEIRIFMCELQQHLGRIVYQDSTSVPEPHSKNNRGICSKFVMKKFNFIESDREISVDVLA